MAAYCLQLPSILTYLRFVWAASVVYPQCNYRILNAKLFNVSPSSASFPEVLDYILILHPDLAVAKHSKHWNTFEKHQIRRHQILLSTSKHPGCWGFWSCSCPRRVRQWWEELHLDLLSFVKVCQSVKLYGHLECLSVQVGIMRMFSLFFRIYNIIILVMSSNEQLHNGEVITHSNQDERSNARFNRSELTEAWCDSTATVFSFEVHRIRIMISTMRAFFSHPSPSIELEKPSPFTSSRIATGSSMNTTGPRNAAKPKKWRITWSTLKHQHRIKECLVPVDIAFHCKNQFQFIRVPSRYLTTKPALPNIPMK